MRNFTLVFIILWFPAFALTQTATKSVPARVLVPKINTIFYKLGEDLIPIRTYQYGDTKDFFFINLHDDEETAVSGAVKILETKGGTLVRLVNYKQRNIRFKMRGRTYTFDPNRIFSRDGITRTLGNFGWSSNQAIEEVEKFADRILALLPPPSTCIIALHNNSDGKFSVTSYLAGNERTRDAREVHIGVLQDPDDLFLTTDSILFSNLIKEKFNVVWQDNLSAKKDGSLSIYCGEKNIRYLNCETEHGKMNQYTNMLITATQFLKKQESNFIAYNYKLSPNPDSIQLAEDCDIYFGDKKVGAIKFNNPSGRIEMDKSFVLYDNMDFFYFPVRNDAPKIEIRVDPTRPRKLYDPNATVPVKIVR